MGDAYYNRGLVLIYLKDKEKGCIDLSRAGELGVGDAYSVNLEILRRGEEVMLKFLVFPAAAAAIAISFPTVDPGFSSTLESASGV